MLVIIIAATVSRVEGWEQIVLFARAKHEWFKEFLELPNGIPCPQTFGRLMARINPAGFIAAFEEWADGVRKHLDGEQIGLDGKRIRAASSRSRNPLHLVSAWAAENRLVLGQRKVADKRNEIDAMLSLIRTLDVRGTTVSIDALGCQKVVAKSLHERKATYLLAL